MRTTPRKKPQGFSSRIVRDTVESPGYRLIRNRMLEVERTLLEALTVDADAVQTAKVRGELAGVRTCLGLPDILIAEKGEPDED